MIVSSPYFDARLKWLPQRVGLPRPVHGSSPASATVRKHPSWFLRSARRGTMAYIPFDCEGGTCPQLAADIANPRFRKLRGSREARTQVRRGYKSRLTSTT